MCSKTHRLLWLAAIFAASCGGSDPIHDCNDGVDNDGDGLVDADDPACPITGDAEFPDPSQCTNGLDDDGDGLTDFPADFGCEAASDEEEEDPTRQCNDMVDNDGDTVTDHPADPGCETPVDNDEFNPALCGNGIDDDGDARIDYPFDPGCESEEDPTETDPATPPQCSDGMDNDLDGDTDFGMDPGCNSAADNDEFNVEFGECGPSLAITDITVAGEATGAITGPLPNELTSPVCNGFGGEFAYTFQVMNPDSALYLTTDYPETTLDTVLYVRSVCQNPGTELECNDDAPDPAVSPSGSTLIIEEIEMGTYFIIVDAFGPGSLGNFRLTVEERAGLGAPCDAGDPTACVPGLICQPRLPGDPDTCEYPRCQDTLDNDADGVIDFPLEPGCGAADDNDETNPSPLPACGNTTDDDGDGLIDYPADPGCEFAGDTVEIDECYPGKPVIALDPVLGATGSTTTDTGVASGSCGGGDSPEDVFVFQADVPLVSVTVSTVNAGTTYDTLLYVRASDCDSGTEVTCNNDVSFSDQHAQVTWSPITGTQYFVFVDGGWMASGSYDLDVSGIIAGGGECDPAIPTFVCESGYACRESVPGATDWQCRVSFCNDDIDNDADGFTDWPNDPGCATLSDDAEDFPNPVTACSNGIDDDADTFIDFAGGDPGCTSAADNGELDECVPGQPVSDHPGGTVTGSTSGAASVMSSPASCDPGGTTGMSPEEVWFYSVDTDLTSITFSTEGSSFDTVLYIRQDDCGVMGPDAWCNDNTGTMGTSSVTIPNPTLGTYFAIVDGAWSGEGSYTLAITGIVDQGGSCTAGSTSFVCETGTFCNALGVCEPAMCNDGLDNDADGDVDYPADPGCTSISDPDEVDPAVLPQCADGIDNDADGDIDWPADDSCGAASDDNEACSVFDTTPGGYSGCTDDLPATPPCENLATLGTASTACSGTDDCVLPGVSIGFTFNYFGIDRTTIDIGSNGKIGFGATSTYSNSCTIENNTIAAYWDDLLPAGGGDVYYQTFGTAPNRHFTVQWNVPHISGGTLYDIRATIYEGSNDIDLCYVDTTTGGFGTDSGASATVGIHGAVAADDILYSCNASTVTDGLLLHITAP